MAAASKPQQLHSTERPGPAEPEPSGVPEPLPPAVRRKGVSARRSTRAVLALAGISAVVAGLIPGDTGTRATNADHSQSANSASSSPAPAVERRQPPNLTNGAQPANVDMTWVPRAKKALAQVNADLAQIDKAQRAAAAVPREQWSARLRTLMERLEKREADQLRLRALLQPDLSLLESYDRAAEGLAGTRHQIELLNQARGSLLALSGDTREETDWILDGLENQTGRLSQQERAHLNKEESLRGPAQQASSKPLPELPHDVPALTRQVNDAVEDSRPPRPTPGPGPNRPGGDAPRSDRPPAAPHSSPGKSKQTTAPPRPSSEHTSRRPAKKSPPPTRKAPPRDDKVDPPKQPAAPSGGDDQVTVPPPAAQPEAPEAPPSWATDGGTGAGATSVGSDSGGSSGGTAGADAGTGSGGDSGVGSGGDSGGDGGDGGGDGGDGGDGGGDGGDGGDGGF